MSPKLIVAVGVALTLGMIVVSRLGGARQRHADAHQQRIDMNAAAAQAERDAVEARDAAHRHRFVEGARQFGIEAAAFGERIQEPWAGREAEIVDAENRADAKVRAATAREAARRSDVESSRLAANRLVALAAAVIWTVSAVAMYQLDLQLLVDQGHSPATARILAAVVAVTLEALGLVALAAIGVHSIGFISDHGRERRIAAAMLALTALGVLVVAALVPLAGARTEKALGGEMRAAEATYAEAQVDGEQSEITAAGLALEDIQKRYDRGERMDAVLAGVLGMLVFGMSWAPVGLAEHARLAAAGRAKRSSESQQMAAATSRVRFDREFTATIAGWLDEAGENPAGVQAMFTPVGPAGPGEAEARPAEEWEHERAAPATEPAPPPPPPPPAHEPAPPFTPVTSTDGTDPFDLYPRS